MSMNSILLLAHVSLAILSIVYALGVVLVTRKRKFDVATVRAKRMWQSTITAMLSGILLAYTTHAVISSTCVSLMSLLVVVSLAHLYLRTARQKSIV